MKLSQRLALLAILATPALALAAEEAGHAAAEHGHAADAATSGGPMWLSAIQFVSAIVVFLIVFFVLAKLAWPKILGGLEEREKKIRSEIFAAEEARKNAQAAQAAFAKEIAEAKAEAGRMIEQARAEQARLSADLKLKAEAELSEMRENANRSIEAAKRAAVSEIYAEAASLATVAAGKILQREVRVDDQKRLIDESMEQLGRQYARA